MGNKKNLFYFCVYTLLFCLIFITGYMAFFEQGKSFMWYDGYIQHYPAMVYIGKYLREIAANFLSGNFTVPMFEFNLGMGQNIIAMLNLFDGFGDPFVLISAFVPVSHTELLYNFLLVVKMYLAGIAFSIFCFYKKKSRGHSLVGALIYVFCGYALFAGVRHPSFLNPMIYFPILLVGTDKLLNKEKPWVFILTVFIAAVNGFYFLYITTIFVFIYALIRYGAIYRNGTWKDFLRIFWRCAFSYILGIIMSALIFVPAVIGFLNSARSDSRVDPGNLFLYDISHYVNALIKSVSPSATWKYLGIAGLCIFATVLIIMRKDKKYRQVKAALIVSSLFYLIPLGGYLTNGFSYVSGRWTFIFSFTLAFIVVTVLPEIQNLSKKELWTCGIFTGVYALIGLIHPSVRNISTIYGSIVLIVSFAVIILIQNNHLKVLSGFLKLPDKPAIQRKGGMVLIILLVTATLSFNANFLYKENFINYISEFYDYGAALKDYRNAEVAAALPLPEDDFYRVDSIKRLFQNAPLILDYPSVTAYYSIINSNVSDALYNLEDSQLSQAYNLYGLDNRTALDTLASVRYISVEEGAQEEYVPYGFVPSYKKVLNNKKYTIYENKFALPLGYTYSSYITEDEFAKLNALQKQEAMLQSVVLEEEIGAYSRGNPLTTSKTIDYTITEMDGVTWEDRDLIVYREDASIEISFNGLPNSETYLRLNNFDIDDSGHENFYIDICSGKVIKTCRVMSRFYKFHLGRKNYLVNLGYSKDGKNTASIHFPVEGRFRLDDIEVYCQPMDYYDSQVEALAMEPLENIKITANKVTGTIDLSEDKILCLSIGYDRGWTAKADGHRVNILKANGMFMGIPLKKGRHKIELNYCTPGIKAGLWLSLAGYIILIGMIIYDKLQNKKLYNRFGKELTF